MKTNLLKETLHDIENFGLRESDIVFIGSRDGAYSCTRREFRNLANIEYDDGYGARMIASDLVIRFKNGGIMFRDEYDGAEWWDYLPGPCRSTATAKPIRSLLIDRDAIGVERTIESQPANQ